MNYLRIRSDVCFDALHRAASTRVIRALRLLWCSIAVLEYERSRAMAYVVCTLTPAEAKTFYVAASAP